MTMTDTEAKALALVNEFRAKCAEPTLPVTMSHVWAYGAAWEALCRVIEREAATEARHAAELREQAERFSDVAAKVSRRLKQSPDANVNWMADLLAPFILPAPDPLAEAFAEIGWSTDSPRGNRPERLRAAMQARGYEWRKIGEAGE